MLVSLAMEGKFSNEGLQALDDDDDMLTAMARELVTQKGVGEKADEIWRQLQQQHSPALTASAVAMVEGDIPPPLTVQPEGITACFLGPDRPLAPSLNWGCRARGAAGGRAATMTPSFRSGSD